MVFWTIFEIYQWKQTTYYEEKHFVNSYLDKLNIIYEDPKTPQEVKSHLDNLIQKVLCTKTNHTELNDQFFYS